MEGSTVAFGRATRASSRRRPRSAATQQVSLSLSHSGLEVSLPTCGCVSKAVCWGVGEEALRVTFFFSQEQARKKRPASQARKENVLALTVSFPPSPCATPARTWRPFFPPRVSWSAPFFPPLSMLPAIRIIALCMMNV